MTEWVGSVDQPVKAAAAAAQQKQPTGRAIVGVR